MATKEHCVYCFDSVIVHFDGKAPAPPAFPNKEFPLFVTWKKEKKPGGAFSPENDFVNLFRLPPPGMHWHFWTPEDPRRPAAFKDSRFDALRRDEVPQLMCGVSLLHEFELVDSVWDWKIGVHGIQISFEDPDNGRKRRATYLPEVAEEQEWTALETLDSLIRKAGYNGTITDPLRDRIQLERYQSSKEKLAYKEYLEFKNKHRK